MPTPRLDEFLSQASFWWPDDLTASAWLEHAPFAFWLIEAHRPRVLAELGTHGGFSYFAFCQAIRTLGLDARCFAVDTWKGDEHAGFYDEDTWRSVSARNEARFGAFSRLVRSTFEDALPHFTEGTIDLLHVDGRHFFDDVKHDFESWRPKLSNRAVVLFHDTNVRESGFGVYKFWETLSGERPSFEFLHGHGLGVLGYGSDLPEPLRRFFEIGRGPEAATAIRQIYSRLGAAIDAVVWRREEQLQHEDERAELEQTLKRSQERARALEGRRLTARLARLVGSKATR